MPRPILRYVRVPWPEDLPPGPLAQTRLDAELIRRGLMIARPTPAPGEDEDRFDPAKAARIVGFVMDVKVGGVETCNCKATNPLDRDTHIELAAAPGAPNNQRVIVEVSPRFRQQMKDKGECYAWAQQHAASHPPDLSQPAPSPHPAP